MSDLVKAIENWYSTMLLAEEFPEAYSWKDKFLSLRAFKQHFAEKNFLKSKKTQILAITHALSSVAVFRSMPDAPKSEIVNVVDSIKRAKEMDPGLFKNQRGDELVSSALSYLEKYDDSTTSGYIHDPVSDKLAHELKEQGYSNQDLADASDFAKKIAEDMFEANN